MPQGVVSKGLSVSKESVDNECSERGVDIG